MGKTALCWLGLVLFASAMSLAHAASCKYFRLRNPQDVQTKPALGILILGAGGDLMVEDHEHASRWGGIEETFRRVSDPNERLWGFIVFAGEIYGGEE